MKVRAALIAIVVAGFAVVPGGPEATAQDCREVAFIVAADAAPVAARLDQGTAVPIPVAYSHVEHETSPQYVYSEAGSTSLGPLEGVVLQPRQLTGLIGGMFPIEFPEIPDIPGAPAVPVPAGRAASTYPESSLPPVATGDWAVGRSRTEASATRAFAASGVEAVGLESQISSTLNCETIVVEASWTLAGITLPGGIQLGRLAQTARVELTPEGEPVVEVNTVILDENLGLGNLFGQIPDDLLGEIFAAGGQEFSIGDPEVTVGDDEVRIVAKPVAMRFAPPGGTQAVGLSVGLLDVTVERLGLVAASTAPTTSASTTTAPAAPVVVPPSTGAAEPPVAVVEAAVPDLVAEPVSSHGSPLDYFVSGGSAWWQPVVAALLIAAVFWRVAVARRDRWPTAHWTLTQLELAGRWFHATYLRW